MVDSDLCNDKNPVNKTTVFNIATKHLASHDSKERNVRNEITLIETTGFFFKQSH